MAYYKKTNRRMSATKKAYLAGKRAGYRSAKYGKKKTHRYGKKRRY